MVGRRRVGQDDLMNDTVITLAAGALFGTGAGLLLIASGRIAGISGIAAGVLRPRAGDFAWRALFLVGLLVGGSVALRLAPQAIALDSPRPLGWLVVAGLCIGVGARLANGCTSGHGVCGVGRLSRRSLVATATFTAAGAITRAIWLQLGGAT
jgi:uncharacterized membrane protein YedE/YeeE